MEFIIEFIFLIFSFALPFLILFYFFKVFFHIIKGSPQNPEPYIHSKNSQQIFFNEDFNQGIPQLLKNLNNPKNNKNNKSIPKFTQKSSNQEIKNLDAEALEKVKFKEELVKNQKIKNIEAESLERWKKKKEQLKNPKYKNIEKEALENSYSKKKIKKIEVQNIKPLQENVDTPKNSISSFQKLYSSKNELKKVFLLKEILKSPEF